MCVRIYIYECVNTHTRTHRDYWTTSHQILLTLLDFGSCFLYRGATSSGSIFLLLLVRTPVGMPKRSLFFSIVCI